MRRVIFTPEARSDLHEIWDYIAPKNLAAADRIVDRVRLAAFKLAEMPGMGHRRHEVRDLRYRFLAVRPYVIAYRFDTDALTIVRVVHGHRDFHRLFRGD